MAPSLFPASLHFLLLLFLDSLTLSTPSCEMRQNIFFYFHTLLSESEC